MVTTNVNRTDANNNKHSHSLQIQMQTVNLIYCNKKKGSLFWKRRAKENITKLSFFFIIIASVSFDQTKINQVLPLQSLRTANFM